MELTTRQKETLKLIIRNSIIGLKTTQLEIYENYPYEPNLRKDGYVWNSKATSHDHCTAIWTDINAINANDEVDKIIIPNNFTYKIAENWDEVDAFTKELYWEHAMAKLWRYGNMRRKAKRNGQCVLPLDDQDKEDFQAYIKNAVDHFILTH